MCHQSISTLSPLGAAASVAAGAAASVAAGAAASVAAGAAASVAAGVAVPPSLPHAAAMNAMLIRAATARRRCRVLVLIIGISPSVGLLVVVKTWAFEIDFNRDDSKDCRGRRR